MTDNLALWKQVEKTDPAHTKAITGKAYKGNSPKPHYIVMKATEAFGPCGIGWGFEIVEEKLLDGALLAPGFNERIHMARVRVWYEWNGKRGTVEHVGQTVFSGRRRDGNPFTDEDAPKKSVTDGLIKALSMVGFAGDIFLGRYDDSKYVDDLKREIAQDNQQAAPQVSPAEDLVAAIKARPSLAAIDKLWARADFKALFNELNAEDQAWVRSVDTSRRAEFEAAAPLMAG
jgi:hypothetical protein